MIEPTGAVFVSYASQDAEAAARIAAALRAAGVEVWLDQSELRGGEAWDRKIRKEIHDCALFIPVISANAHARDEGYFRLEWKLAADRSQLMAPDKTFVLPVVIDHTPQTDERIPDRFRELQWSRLPDGQVPPAFIQRVLRLLSPVEPCAPTAARSASGSAPTIVSTTPRSWGAKPALPVAAAVVVLGALAYFVIDRLWISKHAALRPTRPLVATIAAPAAFAPQPHSIAVLPFVDMSEKRDQEYFSDGLSEELIDHLAHVPDLKVIARTSSFQFKGKNQDVRAIASQLGVAHLLEGSVRKSGAVLRITAQLIRASDGSHLWSETYERKLSDIFKVQEEIAKTVSNALQTALTAGASPPPNKTPPNVEAYNFVLKGNYFKARMNKEDMERAIEAYRKALSIDPQYALAWARLGSAYFNQATMTFAPPGESLTRARAALEQALRIDPDLIWAHYTLAGIYMSVDWDWKAAQAEINRMREIDPSDSYLLPSAIGDLASVFGRVQERIRINQELLDRDPLNTYTLSTLAQDQFEAGQLGECISTSQRLLEIAPNYVGAHSTLGMALLFHGELGGALAEMQREPDEAARLGGLPFVYWALKQRAEADAALAQLTARHASDAAYNVAEVFAYRGEVDPAFAWLNRAYRQRDPGMSNLKSDVLLRNLYSDPRYQALLVKMKLVPPPAGTRS